MPDLPRDQYLQSFKDSTFVRHEAARRSKKSKGAPAQLDLFGSSYTSEELAAGKAGIADARAQLSAQQERSRNKEFRRGPKPTYGPRTQGPPPCLGCD